MSKTLQILLESDEICKNCWKSWWEIMKILRSLWKSRGIDSKIILNHWNVLCAPEIFSNSSEISFSNLTTRSITHHLHNWIWRDGSGRVRTLLKSVLRKYILINLFMCFFCWNTTKFTSDSTEVSYPFCKPILILLVSLYQTLRNVSFIFFQYSLFHHNLELPKGYIQFTLVSNKLKYHQNVASKCWDFFYFSIQQKISAIDEICIQESTIERSSFTIGSRII